MFRWLAAGALAVALFASTPAQAKKGPVPVTVKVVDETGDPIVTAVVRHPAEEERHRVNNISGAWEADTLYLPGGTELKFEPGIELMFEVTASGYVTETVRYIVRKRKNLIVVDLQEIELDEDRVDLVDPIIAFGRDKPIGGQEVPEGE